MTQPREMWKEEIEIKARIAGLIAGVLTAVLLTFIWALICWWF